jgi:EmrB/QacA subfamily drug resistance transporter
MSTTDPLSAPPPVAASADPHHERRWLVLAVLCMAQFMLVLDATILNVALPSAQRALDFSDANRGWILTAYLLAFGSLLPLGGRMSDLWGRKRMFVLGASGFAVASAVAGAAGSFDVLVAARAAQGVFGALLAPAAIAMLGVTFPDPAERAKAFGVFGAVAGSAGAIGVLLGGVLTSYVSWRWCMFVNCGFGAAALVGALSLMHNTTDPNKPRLDWFSTALVTAGLFGLVFGASKAETQGWGAAITLVSLLGGAALLVAFLVTQARVKHPLVPLHVIGDRNRGAGLLALLLGNVAVFAVFLFLTYYMQGVLDYSPVQTGLAFLPMPIGIVIGAILVQGALNTTFSARAFVGAGLLMIAGGAVLLAQLGIDDGYWGWLFLGLAAIGLGIGFALVVAVDLSIRGVAPQDAGIAGSLSNVSQQIGPALGIAVLSTVAATATGTYLTGHAALPDAALHAQVHGFTTAFWYAAAIMGVASVICTGLIRGDTGTAPEAEAPADLGATANLGAA